MSDYPDDLAHKVGYLESKLDEAMNLLERYNATCKLVTAENVALKSIIEAQKGIIKAYETMHKQEDKT